MTKIQLKRVYADPEGAAGDGLRVFVDRLWPRGESKAEFHYDLWAKEVAPSTELREWYHADPEGRWSAFAEKYMAELRESAAARDLASQLKGHPVVTLLYGSRDEEHNNAVVLARYLAEADGGVTAL